MKLNLIAVSYFILLVVSSGDHYRRGRSIFEKRIEDVYWNSVTSCQTPKECSNRSTLSWIESAGLRVKLVCKSTFQYDRWGCSVGKTIFDKVSRESAALYALLSSSLAYEAATFLARNGALPNHKRSRYPEVHITPSYLQQSLQQTKTYLSVTPLKQSADLNLQARRHNAIIGLKVLKQCVSKLCKCHGFSGSCSTKTCWDSLPNFSVIAHRVRLKYLTAVKSQLSNRPRRALGHVKDAISVLDDSDDFCEYVRSRRCRDAKHCAQFCCDGGFHNRTEIKYFHCRCHWTPEYQLACEICIKNPVRYYCD